MGTRQDQIINFFSSIDHGSLRGLHTIYDENATLTDPYRELKSLPAVKRYYEELFNTAVKLNYEFPRMLSDGEDLLALWVLQIDLQIRADYQDEVIVSGCTHFRLAPGTGRVILQREFLDTGPINERHASEVGALLALVEARFQDIARSNGL